MKTTETRIGNIVNAYKVGVCRVDGIESDILISTANDEYIPINDVEGIPLNEQWLLDFGFNQSIEGQWYVHFNEMCLTLYEDLPQYIVEIHDMEMDKSSIFLKSIQYLHQLQNLYFALTQEELILK